MDTAGGLLPSGGPNCILTKIVLLTIIAQIVLSKLRRINGVLCYIWIKLRRKFDPNVAMFLLKFH